MITLVVLVVVVGWLLSGPIGAGLVARQVRRDPVRDAPLLEVIARRELEPFFMEWDALVRSESSS